MLYQLGSQYMPEYETGIRCNSLGIDFGELSPIITEKGIALPPFAELNSPLVFREELLKTGV